MTQKEARKACRWFQQHVALRGWKLNVCIGDIPSGDMGASRNHLRLHKAHVWITLNDSAVTLMHELLHISFDAIGVGIPEIGEHLIDQLAIQLAAQYKLWQTG